jgi:hypothetical protein
MLTVKYIFFQSPIHIVLDGSLFVLAYLHNMELKYNLTYPSINRLLIHPELNQFSHLSRWPQIMKKLVAERM